MDPELIAFAEELASAARTETLHRWASGVTAEDKGSTTFDPVTEADREAERVMRGLIRGRFPEHGITGEEWPDEVGSTSCVWSLDPVDGTRSFMCGLPTWVTLIAFLENDEPQLGLIDAPVLGETYIGASGKAWLSHDRGCSDIATSGCTILAEARLSTTDPFLLGDPGEGPSSGFAAFERLRSTVRVTRFGHDGYAYARLAAGSIDLVVENGLKPHDYNALIPIVRSSGGHIGDWAGGDNFADGAVIAAATRELYEKAVEVLACA
jgi:histidinol phosphatase-like enzyme (inositol monophosphatase family)